MTRTRRISSSPDPLRKARAQGWVAIALFVPWLAGACASDARCREFDLDAMSLHGEVGVRQYAGGAATYQRQPASAVSEEAAIYSKRHKTLCQLLWDGRIDHSTYERSAAEAYDAYRATRGAERRAPEPELLYP